MQNPINYKKVGLFFYTFEENQGDKTSKKFGKEIWEFSAFLNGKFVKNYIKFQENYSNLQ